MSRGSKLKDMHVGVLVVVMLGVSAGCVWWMYVLPRQQARHWIKYGYPFITSLGYRCPYGEPEEWAEYGRKIRGIDSLLVEMYDDPEIWSRYRNKLLEGMCEAGGRRTLGLLTELARNTADEDLAEDGVIGLGGFCRRGDQEAGGILLGIAQDAHQSIYIRARSLRTLIWYEQTPGIRFAAEHGAELMEEAKTQSADQWTADWQRELVLDWLSDCVALAREETAGKEAGQNEGSEGSEALE